MRKVAGLAVVAVAVAACQDSTSPGAVVTSPPTVHAARSAGPNDYIVVFRDDEADPAGSAAALVKAHGGSLRHVYRTALKGFAVAGLPDAAVEALQRNPRVARVEPDGIVTVDAGGTESPTPSWGLDRIDATKGLDNSYTYPNDGSGVTAYIIDTGIYAGSSDFGSRIGTGDDEVDGGTPDDCHGHGTHVAGTVGGTKYGVAKAVTIVAVRVLDCAGQGTDSDVIAGIDWVATNAAGKVAVANMSLGGPPSQALDDAVTAAIAKGIVFAVAAGNSSANACNYSPSRTPNAITVGATTSSDAMASYSNYGSCVDINAPGSGITSDWIGSATATNTISGTSMATPHVTGVAALYRSQNTAATPSEVASALVNGAVNNVLSVRTGTPNKLLNVSFVNGTGSSPTLAASFTKLCTNLDCTFDSSPSTGSITSRSWSSTDGATGSGTTFQHKFAARGNYTVTLIVGDGTTTASTSQTVTCNPKKCQ